jgi:hypothetical protein
MNILAFRGKNMQIACPKHPNEDENKKLQWLPPKKFLFQSYIKHLL